MSTLETVMTKVLMNMGAPYPGNNVTKRTLVQLMVNLEVALTNCYTPVGNFLTLIAGGNILSISGSNLVLI